MSLKNCMATSSYFGALIPYLHHLTELQLKQLPPTYFKDNSEIDMIFRVFYARFILPALTLDAQSTEEAPVSVCAQMRKPGDYDTLLERIRRSAQA